MTVTIVPDTTEERFVQAYAECIYAFEPSAEPVGTCKHIMNVVSPDTLVELPRGAQAVKT